MALFGKKDQKEEEEKNDGLEIDMAREGTELIVKLYGRLDSLTSPELEDKLEGSLGDVKKLIFDFEHLDYISSAGLRVILGTSQELGEVDGGEIVIRNLTEQVQEVFDVTGFNKAFNIE